MVTCPTLVPLNNGSIVYSVDTERIGYGVTATYSCDVEGLGLTRGDTVRTCAPDGGDIGKWTGYAPSCESEWLVLKSSTINYGQIHNQNIDIPSLVLPLEL